MDSVSPLVAFVGGLVSLVSPCLLPMIPVYIGSLSGPQVLKSGIAGHRLGFFFHSLSFIAGFSIVFVLLGTGAGMLGFTISSNLLLIRRIAGSLMILFGIFMLAATRISWLNYEKRLNPSGSLASGYLRSFILGILFTLAWTPCVGPVLGI
jgi:cytochrome c-type biogenesis protein